MNRRSFNQISTFGLMSLVLGSGKSDNYSSNPAPFTIGDTIALIAPGSPITKSQLASAKNALIQLGFKVVYRDDITSSYGFLAGNDQRRKAEIEQFLADDAVKALWAVRGGYGCVRLLPLLDQDLIINARKPILGYSDLTALINWWDKIGNIPSYHCAMPKDGFSAFSKIHLNAVLLEQEHSYLLDNDKVEMYNFIETTGQLAGGNLTVMASLVGTPYEVTVADRIVFLEDVGEKPYRIDRMLNQIDQAQSFSSAKAVLLGNFNDCEAPAGSNSFSLIDTLLNFFLEKGIPVLLNLPFGHIDDQWCLPIGPEISLTKNKIFWK